MRAPLRYLAAAWRRHRSRYGRASRLPAHRAQRAAPIRGSPQMVVCRYPGSAFTNAFTISHAATRSRLPSATRRLERIASSAPTADCCASSSVTSPGTFPNGPAGDPSGVSAPCPDTIARPPRTRTHAKGIDRPCGIAGPSGNDSPRWLRRSSIAMIHSRRRCLTDGSSRFRRVRLGWRRARTCRTDGPSDRNGTRPPRRLENPSC
jgi:hypothetical protein